VVKYCRINHRDTGGTEIFFFISFAVDPSTICRSYGAGTAAKENQSALLAFIVMSVKDPVLKEGVKRPVLKIDELPEFHRH